jgi:hypothetical protein
MRKRWSIAPSARARRLTRKVGELRGQGVGLGLAVASGAEWSLFCPTIGMALDSWPRLMVALVRPVSRPAVGVPPTAADAGVGAGAEAGGKDGSGPTVGSTPALAVSTAEGGEGPVVTVFPQALSHSVARLTAAKRASGFEIRMVCLKQFINR